MESWGSLGGKEGHTNVQLISAEPGIETEDRPCGWKLQILPTAPTTPAVETKGLQYYQVIIIGSCSFVLNSFITITLCNISGHGMAAATASIPSQYQTIVTDNSEKKGFLSKSRRFPHGGVVSILFWAVLIKIKGN